jgi:TolC family type I secretion outer membrane protein
MLLVAACVLAGEPARGQTLEEALVAAYRNNPTLEARRARLRTADEQVPQALANWRPRVTALGEVGARRLTQAGPQLPTTTDVLYPSTLRATIEQPLFRGGRTLAATRGAEHAVLAERARLLTVEQVVLRDAATAYTNVVRDQSVLELNILAEQRFARELEATKDRFQVGEVTRTDVFQAEARLARATADRIGSEGALEASRAVYRNLIGDSPGALVRPPVPEPLPASLDEATEAAIANNPSIYAEEFDERSALDRVDEVRGELLPSVSLAGSAEREMEQIREDGRFDTFEALVTVTVPLYQSGAVYSRVRAAKQAVAEQRREMDQARRNVIRDTTQAWSDLSTARAAIGSRTKEVEANQVALEGVRREAEVGARTVLDILDAEQELLNSQVNLVRAQRDEIVAAFDLRSATGALTAQLLDLPVEFYDAEQHYREVRGKWFGTSSSGDISGDFDRFRGLE